jgi:chemotaxis methyl-accepting protein methylase
MMSTAQDQSQSEMSGLETGIWQEFISRRCGLHFTAGRLDFLRRRLLDRMRACQIWNATDYYHYVAYNPAGEIEWSKLLYSLLNNDTSFFRHPPSFETLTGHLLPQLIQEKEQQGLDLLTMWSVGCSTGQEVYSLAMAYLELIAALEPANGAGQPAWRVSIIGSDLSQPALDKARRGRYRLHEMRRLPEPYRQQYMTALENGWGGQSFFQVKDHVRSLVQFSALNLCEPDSYQVFNQDIIFCQNVLIYFKTETRFEIILRLSERLAPGGYLLIAPGEVIDLNLPNLKPVRLNDTLIYQRVD